MTDRDAPEWPFPSRRQLHAHDPKVFADEDRLPEEAETPAIPLFPGTSGPVPPAEPGETTSGLRSRRLEHERARARRRRRNQRIRTGIILVVVLALLGGGLWFAWGKVRGGGSSPQSDDYPGPGSGSVQVTVESGDVGTDIGQKLVDQDVVKSLAAFTRAFDANRAATSIKPGTYTLKQQMSASEAVAALLDDANRSDNTVTVIEGQTAAQVAEKMASVTDFSADDIDAAMKDAQAIGLPEEAGGDVEGWLEPGTYEVSSSDTPQSLFSQMVSARVDELDRLGVAEGDRQTILTKASILEREMNIDEYLPQVARVIDNRLDDSGGETKGLLQMDSTVLYGVGKTGGVPTDADYQDDNPYNTYLHAGLPPTPISQPSEKSLEATLHPADGSWLYFVTVDLDTGETLFATTLDEQEQNKTRFNEYCASHPGKCTS
jgi:UPF0755 protein